MRKTFQYRLYPTKAQIAFLDQQLGEACDLYNCALQERRDAWQTCRVSLNYYDQAKQLKPMRHEGLIGLANFSCCQDVLRRVDKTFCAFFKRNKKGRKAGYPRFKPFHRYDSITFPTYGDGCKLLDTGKLRIQGAGHIKVRLHRALQGTIRTLTIKRNLNRWYVCFSVECEAQPLPPSSEEIGLDVGLNSYAVLSDGTEIRNPGWLRKAHRSLRRKQRQLARAKRGSKRRRKAARSVAAAHGKVFRQRNDFQHKLSRKLVNRYGLIAMENLNIRNMTATAKGTVEQPGKHVRQKAGLNRSILDAAWGLLFQKMAYKASIAHRLLRQPPAWNSSQECLCGASVPKTLNDRWHHCTACGLSGPRDHVSARVILQRARNWPSDPNVEEVVSCVVREAVCFS
jgi:putative transposase